MPEPDATPAVDVHAHFVPTGYAGALADRGLARPDGMPVPPWSAQAHLAAMDRLGIATSVISLSSPGVVLLGEDASAWARRVNDEASQLVADHPDRFAFFATLDLSDVDAACQEATRALTELGAAGIVLLTNHAGTYLGDPRLDTLMAHLDAARATVFVHPASPRACEQVDMGRPAPLLEYLIDSTRAFSHLYLSGVLTRFPGVHWIVAHNGALLPGLVDRLDLLAPLVLGGTAPHEPFTEVAARLYYEVGSSAPFPRAARAALGLTTPDHLLLGTDLAYAPPTAIAANVEALRAGRLVEGEELAALLHGNARRLLVLS